ncbi:MAG: hypothetical protein EB127_09590 [Alphaproteobacteria bacterium]|nr:hypothetical protein [Alphaproteobacteria bacterium]
MLKLILTRLFDIFLIALLWFILAGSDGIKHFPLFSCSVVIISVIVSFNIAPERSFNPLRFFLYFAWLFNEIANSTIAVSRIIWSLEEVKPEMIKLKTRFIYSKGKLALYASSITLTPGTIAIETQDGEILVHSLTSIFSQDLALLEMEKRIKLL